MFEIIKAYKCYYNNVAELKKEPQNVFQKEHTLWLEYEGFATIGVDLSQISVKVDKNKVTITLTAVLFAI